jgi:hypothetical protein
VLTDLEKVIGPGSKITPQISVHKLLPDNFPNKEFLKKGSKN